MSEIGYINPELRKKFEKQQRRLSKQKKEYKKHLFEESKKIINQPVSQGMLHRNLLALEMRELGVTAKEFREWFENDKTK